MTATLQQSGRPQFDTIALHGSFAGDPATNVGRLTRFSFRDNNGTKDKRDVIVDLEQALE